MAETSIPVQVTLPPINQPVIDRKSGLVTEPWYRYFESLRDRTGGDLDLVDNTKVAASVADDKAVVADDKAVVADQKAVEADQKALTADEKAQAAQQSADDVAAALATSDGTIAGQQVTLDDHETRIAALEAVVFP